MQRHYWVFFMVGALVATMVNVKFAWTPSIGEVTLNMQNNIDMILPRLLPAAIVGIVYWMLGKKNMTSTKAIFRRIDRQCGTVGVRSYFEVDGK